MAPKHNISGKAQDRVHLCLQHGDVAVTVGMILTDNVGAVPCGSDVLSDSLYIIFQLLKVTRCISR